MAKNQKKIDYNKMEEEINRLASELQSIKDPSSDEYIKTSYALSLVTDAYENCKYSEVHEYDMEAEKQRGEYYSRLKI